MRSATDEIGPQDRREHPRRPPGFDQRRAHVAPVALGEDAAEQVADVADRLANRPVGVEGRGAIGDAMAFEQIVRSPYLDGVFPSVDEDVLEPGAQLRHVAALDAADDAVEMVDEAAPDM